MEIIRKTKKAHCLKTKGLEPILLMIFKGISKIVFKMNKFDKMNVILRDFMKITQTSMTRYLL